MADTTSAGTVHDVAAGVRALQVATADGKLGVVAGTDRALAIDGGLDRAEGSALADVVRSLGHRADLILYTHGHIDHVGGGIAFAGGVVLAHELAEAHIIQQLPAWAERAGEPLESFRSSVALPTRTFTGEQLIDLGGRHVLIIDTPGHAPGATVAYLPDDGIVFGSDTLVTGIPPSFRDGDAVVMEGTLRHLAGLDAQILIPGHGPIVRGRRAVREAIIWAADYLARAIDHVERHLRHLSTDQIVASAPYDDFIGERLPRQLHRMEWRHENTIRILVDQLGQRGWR